MRLSRGASPLVLDHHGYKYPKQELELLNLDLINSHGRIAIWCDRRRY